MYSENGTLLPVHFSCYTKRIRLLKSEHMESLKTSRRQQKQRDKQAERAARRWSREQQLLKLPKLSATAQQRSLTIGLARPSESVRGLLLQSILTNATQNPHNEWVFNGSIRDLAVGGLDGKRHSRGYLRACLQDFARVGILEKRYARKGKPTVYIIHPQ